MDVIELTRQLGAAIQADERYAKFADAKAATEAKPIPKPTPPRRTPKRYTLPMLRCILRK